MADHDPMMAGQSEHKEIAMNEEQDKIPSGPFIPEEKHPDLEKFLNILTGKNRVETIKSYGCTTCSAGLVCQALVMTQPVILCQVGQSNHHLVDHEFRPFRDSLSAKEYTISGMCQACQDIVFR